jgi:endonuclease YncB( thermonuclease family)
MAREVAFVLLQPDGRLAQQELLAQGEAIVSADVSDRDCAASLLAAEGTARDAKRGIWADPAAIKNTESPGDILAGLGVLCWSRARFCPSGRQGLPPI